MAIRWFALVFGLVNLGAGVVGFFPQLLAPVAPDMATTNHGLLFGLFAMNSLHAIIHAVVGLIGIAAFATLSSSLWYSRIMGWVFLILAVLGLIPATRALGGILPMYGWDVALHLVLGIAALIAGYGLTVRTTSPIEQ